MLWWCMLKSSTRSREKPYSKHGSKSAESLFAFMPEAGKCCYECSPSCVLHVLLSLYIIYGLVLWYVYLPDFDFESLSSGYQGFYWMIDVVAKLAQIISMSGCSYWILPVVFYSLFYCQSQVCMYCGYFAVINHWMMITFINNRYHALHFISLNRLANAVSRN